VASAFAIMGIVMAIFSVLAFVLFADRDPYNFGTFSKAYFTMFQVLLYACGAGDPAPQLLHHNANPYVLFSEP
jgi:hypothetical protein